MPLTFKDLEKFRVFNDTFYFINNKDGKIYVKSSIRSFDISTENLNILDVLEVSYNNRTFTYYSTPSKIRNAYNPNVEVIDYGKNVLLAHDNIILAADSYGIITIYNTTLGFNGYIKTKEKEHGSFLHGAVSDAFYFLDNKDSNNLIIIPFSLENKSFCSINASKVAVNDNYIIGVKDGSLNFYDKNCTFLTSLNENISFIESWENQIYVIKDDFIYRINVKIEKKKEEIEEIEEKKGEEKKIINETKKEVEEEKKVEEKGGEKVDKNLALMSIIFILILLFAVIIMFLLKSYPKKRKNRK